jgi:hypothetical protein
MRLQAGGQFFRHNVRAGTGLAGNRYGVPEPAIFGRSQPLAYGLYLGVDESPTALQSICQVHNLSLLPSLTSVFLLRQSDPSASPYHKLRHRRRLSNSLDTI